MEDVYAVGGLDGVVVNVETVGEHQRLPRQQVRRDGLPVHLGLQVVWDQHHHDVGIAGDVGDEPHLQTVPLRLGHAAAALVQAHLHADAAVMQVQRVGVALAAVSDYADRLALQQRHVGVVLVVHLYHGESPVLVVSLQLFSLSVVQFVG